MAGVSIEYAAGQTSLRGYLVKGDPRHSTPGILIFHGGAGLDQHAREQSQRYADLGYVVMAADLFGLDGPPNREQVVATITSLRSDRELLGSRTSAALEVLRKRPECSGAVGVVGFCFGGLAALEYARSGADIAAAVSIHGSLATIRPAEPGSIRARLLVCHGAEDPHVPLADTAAFAAEMQAAHADWEIDIYGGAMHGFTHRDAVGAAAKAGVQYNEDADRRSFARASTFLSEAFQPEHQAAPAKG